jgi:type II secretory pathway pseudopilin PulG
MSRNAVLASAAVAVVVIAIVAGLVLVGSPGEQRLRRIDQRRVADLQRLASVLDTYYYANDALPPTLEPLVDGRRLSAVPRDPSTDAVYTYRPTGDRAYELCAVFDRPSDGLDPFPYDVFWSHDGGEKCFSFVVPQRDRGR